MKWKTSMLAILIVGANLFNGCRQSATSIMPAPSPSTAMSNQNLELLHERAKSRGIHLTEIDKFPKEYREAASLLRNITHNADEYYVTFKEESVEGDKFLMKDLGVKANATIIGFNCMHITLFTDENREAVGNPGGKNFTRYYDKKQKKFSTGLSWQ